MAPPNWPTLIIEGGFAPGAPVQPAGAFTLDDATYGKLDTGTLGTSTTWTDLSAWVRSGTVNRPASRQQGPLYAYQQGTASVVLNNADGRFDPDNLAGPYVSAGTTDLDAMTPVRVRAIWAGVSWGLFSGFADSWADDGANRGPRYAETTLAASDGQKVLNGINLPAAASAGAGETTGARITRILNAAQWYTGTGQRSVATGNSTVQATAMGDSAWNLMQVTTDSEIGELYLNGSGVLVFRNRQALLTDIRSNTPQAVFGDVPGAAETTGTELPYYALPRARDDSTMANDIQATRAGGTLQEATDSASVARYLFPRSYTRADLILQDDATALSWAQWVLYISKTDEDRFDTLVINPLRDPVNLWPQVLGRELGDRIQIWRRPPGVVTGTPWSLTNNYGAAPADNFTIPTTSVPQLTLGDRFQIYASGVLKEPAVFTVTFIAGDFFGNTAITFTPAAQSVLAVGDVVTQTGGTIRKDCFIRGIAHAWDVSAGTWQTTWTLQDASKYGSFLTLDNATLGQLNSNALAF